MKQGMASVFRRKTRSVAGVGMCGGKPARVMDGVNGDDGVPRGMNKDGKWA
jgi:hypothetical protein